jgi:hypothetical protein
MHVKQTLSAEMIGTRWTLNSSRIALEVTVTNPTSHEVIETLDQQHVKAVESFMRDDSLKQCFVNRCLTMRTGHPFIIDLVLFNHALRVALDALPTEDTATEEVKHFLWRVHLVAHWTLQTGLLQAFKIAFHKQLHANGQTFLRSVSMGRNITN